MEVSVSVVAGPRAERKLPQPVDIVVAVALALFAQVDLRFDLDNSTHFGPDPATVVVVAVATLALAWRRCRPLATVAVVAVATAGPQLIAPLTITLWGHFVPLLVACYSMARWCGRRGAVAGTLITVAAVVVIMLRVPSIGTAANIPFTLVPFTAAIVVGRVLRRRAQTHRALADRADHLERLDAEREAQLAAAIADERNRIARELHDIVAHSVSVMVVQAGASEDLLERAPERAAEPLRAVQETGRQAVAELGRMLGLLRGSGSIEPADGLAPQPGIAQLPELVERLAGLGLPVRLDDRR